MTVGWKTLDVGEQALIYSLQGQSRIEQGPKRLFLYREKYFLMRRNTANQSEYLKIIYKDGRVEHKPGPCVVFFNQVNMKKVECLTGISLDANEVLVVYHLEPKTNEVVRHLSHGPSIYTPSPNEWLHEFTWHGTDPENKTRKIPGSLKFTKLQIIPDQFYYNVDEVRTADEALIRIKLMIFYELTDIEKMLNSTKDPIADFINCTCADVVAFTSKLSYMEFIEQSGQLNDLEHYPQLVERSKVIGYSVSKVVFRGYYASPTLQGMHDTAINKRTQLKIEYESEEQKQALTDINLQNEVQRVIVEQKIETGDLEHQQKIQRSEEEHRLEIKKQSVIEQVKRYKKQEAASIEKQKALNQYKESFYGELHGLGVQMTKFVVSENPAPNKVIRVVADNKAANFHIHQSS